MSKVAPAEHNLCECINTGQAAPMQEVISTKMEGGVNIEVLKYTCPRCGFTKTVVDTHGKRNVTQAQYNAALNS